MRVIKADLLEQVVTSYDKTKTTIFGRVQQKNYNGVDVLGAPISRYMDVVTDSTLPPLATAYSSPNGRIFVFLAAATGVATVGLYDYNYETGENSYVGRLNFALPALAATTWTITGLRVVDNGTTGWRLYLAGRGSVLVNGGVFCVNGIGKADFTQIVQPTIQFATGDNQRAVYFCQTPMNVTTASATVTAASPCKVQLTGHKYLPNDAIVFLYGTLPTGLTIGTTYYVRNPSANDFELSLAAGGVAINTTGSNGTAQIGMSQAEVDIAGFILDEVNSKLFSHRGLAASHQYYVRDITSPLTYATQIATVTVGTPGKVQISNHPYNNGDQITFLSGTLPTGLLVSTTYFVRAVTQNDFELSLTAGGVAINTTGTGGTATIGRAFGITGDGLLYRTGLLPALTGTLLLTDSEARAVPVDCPINGSVLNGNPCAFFATTTNLYLGLLSELTAGVVSWPSLTTANVLGVPNEVTTPTPTVAGWSNTIDAAMFVTNTAKIVIKKFKNNEIVANFGNIDNKVLEAINPVAPNLGFVTVLNFANESGWVFVLGGTVGQRGIMAINTASDQVYNRSYITTKVMTVPNARLLSYNRFEEIYDNTGELKVEYRTTDFDSVSGGWIELPKSQNLESIAIDGDIQFKLSSYVQSEGYSSGPQISEFLFSLVDQDEICEEFEYSHDDSSTGIPTRVGFRLKYQYPVSVPNHTFRAFDLDNNLLVQHTLVGHPERFEVSTDDGVSWSPFSFPMANIVGTKIRYTFSSPPGVAVRIGFVDND